MTTKRPRNLKMDYPILKDQNGNHFETYPQKFENPDSPKIIVPFGKV